MKKNLLRQGAGMMALCMSCILLTACPDNDPDPVLKVSPTELKNISVNGTTKSLSVESNVDWTVTVDEDWVEVTPSRGSGNGTLHVDIEENEGYGDSREATITIMGEGLMERVSVSQKSQKAQLSVDKTSQKFDPSGGSSTFFVTANLGWTVSSSEGWLTVTPSGSNGSASFEATAEANTGSERTATLTVSPKEGGVVEAIRISVSQGGSQLTVSPTSASLLSHEGASTSLEINVTGNWSLRNLPEWLHSSATGGTGHTTVTLTTLSENFSDEDRSATLDFVAGGNSVAVRVAQAPALARNCRVGLSNLTIMADGFAADLTFGSAAKGYKEAFFTLSAVANKTERDLYNELMEQTEYSKTAELTFLPGWTDPGATVVYCAAAYGNENNADGTHKYGPMLMQRITMRSQETPWADMLLQLVSASSTQWAIVTSRQGVYGQKCDEYYIMGWEGDLADEMYVYVSRVTYALVAHNWLKPVIEAKVANNYKYGPQTITFQRSDDRFLFVSWGVDRDTKELSAELTWVASQATGLSAQRPRVPASEWNRPRRQLTKADVARLAKSAR